MDILVTGGAGFIGSNFIRYALKTNPNDRIICVDAFTYAGNADSIADVRNRIEVIRGDITDKKVINEIFMIHRPNTVVNFAAETHVDRSILHPDVFVDTNIIGTFNLLEACRKYGIKRYHQISTDEVYGDLPIEEPDMLFTEDSTICPSSPYSASKAAADLMALSYYRTYKVPVTISRCSNNYGPYQHPEKLIPKAVVCILRNKKIPIYGNGKNVRDWVYVDDHCDAIDKIIRFGKPGSVYNVGGGCEKSNIEVVLSILQYLNRSEELIEYVADRAGHDRRYAINSSYIGAELNWHPKIDFDKGIEKTIEWYLRNPEWLFERLV